MTRTRIAPSPTGMPHIGTIYQALFSYSYAKRNNGKFIVRIEDTDRARLVEGAEEKVFNAIDLFGLTEDESVRKNGDAGPYKQSERIEIYKKYIDELIEKKGAYYRFCTKERLDALRSSQAASKQQIMYDGMCREISLEEAKKRLDEPHVIRLKVPKNNEKYKFIDEIRGEIEFDLNLLEDSVLIKSDGFPTYHFAVVIDDHLMQITDVIRGEEWISSTPKHTLLYEYFGWSLPKFYHTPDLRNSDKSKLSKRHGHAEVGWYLEEGYLPEAILNFLALMGWSHPDQKEKFDLDEFISLFDPKDLKPVGPVFDLTKLEWLNGLWIRELSADELKKKLINYYKDDKEFKAIFDSKHVDLFIGLSQNRIKKLSEFKNLVNSPDEQREFTTEEKEKGKLLLKVLEEISPAEWQNETILNHLKNFRDKEDVSMKTIYFLITGGKQGLPLIESMIKIDGRAQTLENLKKRTE